MRKLSEVGAISITADGSAMATRSLSLIHGERQKSVSGVISSLVLKMNAGNGLGNELNTIMGYSRVLEAELAELKKEQWVPTVSRMNSTKVQSRKEWL